MQMGQPAGKLAPEAQNVVERLLTCLPEVLGQCSTAQILEDDVLEGTLAVYLIVIERHNVRDGCQCGPALWLPGLSPQDPSQRPPV